MDAALNVFVNGLTGVFVGMSVLYLTVKVISVLGREPKQDKKEQ